MEETPIGSKDQDTNPESQRRDTRDSLFVLARLKMEGEAGEGVTVRVRNVSSGGLMADAPDDYRSGQRVLVVLENIGTLPGVVAWAEAGRLGISFDHPIDKSRARKPTSATAKDNAAEIYKPLKNDYRRPPLKPRG